MTIDPDEVSRRAFLRILSGAFGGAILALEWPEVASACGHAHRATRTAAGSASFLTSGEAADVEAIAAQIIPSDTTPGAREAGVASFIDRALASFFSRMAPGFRLQLAEFQALCRARNPDAASFAKLAFEQQTAFLRTVQHTPFFDTMRLLTTMGMFAMPAYGGNRDGAGWKLLGFQDQHIFVPPFGYYDRDYPGFVIQSARSP